MEQTKAQEVTLKKAIEGPSAGDGQKENERRALVKAGRFRNWRYLLDQKPDKGLHKTAMFWFLGSDSEQHEPLSDIIEWRVLPGLIFFATSELNQLAPLPG